ncbi:MAG: TlpA family protein disulfide reductase [Salinivirgaceae bacterium]|nr:TlpA family protein disulfide reductase [Salinivirgaceae bacterium]
MNKLFNYLMCGALSVGLLASCTQKSKTFVVEGFVDEAITDSAYNVYIGDENFNVNMKEPVDVVVVKDKKFHYECNVDYPTFIYFRAIFPGNIPCQDYVNLILVPGGTAKVTVHNGYFDLEGSDFYKSWHQFDEFYDQNTSRLSELSRQLQSQETLDEELYKQYLAVRDSVLENLIAYAKAHNSEEGAMIYASNNSFVHYSVLFDSIAAPEIKNGVFKNYINMLLEAEAEAAKRQAEAAEKQKATAVGAMFSDFEVEYDGKTQKLSDFVGKGQYVLVDFWASWCGPCRQEIPNIINVYNKYKNKNLNVLGVAVSDRVDDTKRAVEELEINYPQIMAEQSSVGAEAYGILGIPHIILFGPDGTILARDLRGEMIEAAVKQHLGL